MRAVARFNATRSSPLVINISLYIIGVDVSAFFFQRPTSQCASNSTARHHVSLPSRRVVYTMIDVCSFPPRQIFKRRLYYPQHTATPSNSSRQTPPTSTILISRSSAPNLRISTCRSVSSSASSTSSTSYMCTAPPQVNRSPSSESGSSSNLSVASRVAIATTWTTIDCHANVARRPPSTSRLLHPPSDAPAARIHRTIHRTIQRAASLLSSLSSFPRTSPTSNLLPRRSFNILIITRVVDGFRAYSDASPPYQSIKSTYQCIELKHLRLDNQDSHPASYLPIDRPRPAQAIPRRSYPIHATSTPDVRHASGSPRRLQCLGLSLKIRARALLYCSAQHGLLHSSYRTRRPYHCSTDHQLARKSGSQISYPFPAPHASGPRRDATRSPPLLYIERTVLPWTYASHLPPLQGSNPSGKCCRGLCRSRTPPVAKRKPIVGVVVGVISSDYPARIAATGPEDSRIDRDVSAVSLALTSDDSDLDETRTP
ncbi:hypothetical protein BDN71DRAFT_1513493 [Pleurotus eryngii]|uniref:Uncharacterized protein n=1 Tax=Pleurotus eryngii TaxID=5323 RepID=A0A9P5ZHQ7_PLEER|nr:hypothetical protein BDN71DRAFT_1513493 [Pleurotus eryngii]